MHCGVLSPIFALHHSTNEMKQNKLTQENYNSLASLGFSKMKQGKKMGEVIAELKEECKQAFGFFVSDMQMSRIIDRMLKLFSTKSGENNDTRN